MAAEIGGFQGGSLPRFMFISPTDTKFVLHFCRNEKEIVAFTNFFLYLCKKYNTMYTFVFVYQGKKKPMRIFRFTVYEDACLFCACLMKNKQNAFTLSRFYRWTNSKAYCKAVYRNTMFFRTAPIPLNPYETSEEYYYLSPKKYDDLIGMSEHFTRSDLDDFRKKVYNV